MRKYWGVVFALIATLALATVASASTVPVASSITDIQGDLGPVGTLSFDYVGGGLVSASVSFFNFDPDYLAGYCDTDCVLRIGLMVPTDAVDTPTINYADFSSASSPWSGGTETVFALGNIAEWETASVTFSASDLVKYIHFTGSQSDPQSFDGLLGSLDSNVPLIPTNSPTSTPEPSCLVLLGSGMMLGIKRWSSRKD